MFTATLIAAGRLSPNHLATAQKTVPVNATQWLDEGDAADLTVDHGDLGAIRAALEAALPEVDVVVRPAGTREKKLLVADMDSTMITVECIDELADYAGLKPQIAAITERAMRGELDFAEALAARVALLKGLEVSAIDRCRAERVRLMPGARTLVQTMRARGATTVLVSGGFTAFADPVGHEIGFDEVIANRLDVDGDRLAGTVASPIVDAGTKERTLRERRASLGLDDSATLAVGDGANDLRMIAIAGLGVAYRAKPVVAAAAGARIDRNDLTALLWAQGIARRDWVE